LLRRIFPTLAELRDRYHLSPNSPWVWAYYPLRFCRLFTRDLPASLRFWRGDAQIGVAISHSAHSRQFQQWLTGAPNPAVDHPRQHHNGATD
jgi:hypothetical protein